MGRGKAWSREESEAVAKAWKLVTKHSNPQRDQHSKRFTSDLYEQFLDLAPSDQAALDKRWRSRSQTAVKTHFDSIGEEVMKFNSTLTSVIQQAMSRPIEISEQKIIRAAIGLHLGSMKLPIDFENIEAQESDWKLYQAWRILSTSPRYVAPAWAGFRNQLGSTNDESSDPAPSDQVPQHDSIENETQPFLPTSNAIRHTGGTPMRTLASAALSMPLITDVPSMAALTDHPIAVATRPHDEIQRRRHVTTDEHRAPEHHVEHTLGKRPSLHGTGSRDGSTKEARTAPLEMIANGSKAIEYFGEALIKFGDALSEYNALTLFSRPDMQGRHDQKIFFDALAEKHVLKAKLDRNRLFHEVQQRRDPQPSNTFPE